MQKDYTEKNVKAEKLLICYGKNSASGRASIVGRSWQKYAGEIISDKNVIVAKQ